MGPQHRFAGQCVSESAQGGLAAHSVGAAGGPWPDIPVFGAQPRRPAQSGGCRGVPEQHQSVQAKCGSLAAGPKCEWHAVPQNESQTVITAMVADGSVNRMNGENFAIISHFVFSPHALFD